MHTLKNKSVRNLRIQPRTQERKYRRRVEVPEILLRGKWLEKSGFITGERVSINVSNGCLIITPESSEDKSQSVLKKLA